MLIIDGHLDLAWNAVELDRDLTAPLEAIRRSEGDHPAHGEGVATVSLPALRAGGIAAEIATIFTYPLGTSSVKLPGYASPEEAHQRAMAQFAYYRELHSRGEATVLRSRADLDTVIEGNANRPGLTILMEGADPLRTLDDLPVFAEMGLRIIGLSWKATRYAGGAGQPGPLTELGRELLREMDRLGIALDISHLAEEAFWEALRIFRGTIIASHANCRALVPGERQLSDDMLCAIADRDGVIGVMFYNPFIKAGWQAAWGKEAVSLRDLSKHIAHMQNIIGPRHIGLGTDMDGGVGRNDIPREIDSITDLPRVAEFLASAGYQAEEIAGIMGENWLRILHGVL